MGRRPLFSAAAGPRPARARPEARSRRVRTRPAQGQPVRRLRRQPGRQRAPGRIEPRGLPVEAPRLGRRPRAGEAGHAGGGALAVDLALAQGLTMTTELEVARSFYAHLDGSLAPRAEPAARLGVVVARHFGHRRAP